jgi:hypothetical protein
MMTWVFLGGYSLVFFGLLFGVALWRRKKRKERAPFPQNAKLLRGPGETLRKQLAALDESLFQTFLFTFVLPLGVGGALAWIATAFNGPAALFWVALALVGLLASLVFSIRHLVRGLDRWRNTWLGYYGERIVAESLDDLKARGFLVFHDVPAGDTKAPFNIDHVLVGPSGVFAVETKTRRKGRARAGFAEHQIIYDGQVLAYPWGEDRHGLDQARRQALWLQDHLAGLLGETIPVFPILTFPGWMILRRGTGVVNVLNPREIISAVAPRGEPALSDRQIDLIARQLDARCRDVEF